jgi:hypothetical protein
MMADVPWLVILLNVVVNGLIDALEGQDIRGNLIVAKFDNRQAQHHIRAGSQGHQL